MDAALGTNNDLLFLEISPALSGQVNFAFYSPACFALAFDTWVICIVATSAISLMVVAKGKVTTLVANLGFLPTGVSIDSTRKLVYVSNGPGNEIAVYNTSCKLLTTIQ